MLAANDTGIWPVAPERRSERGGLERTRIRRLLRRQDRAAGLVIDIVSAARGINRRQLLGRRKSMRVALSRQLAMYLVHTLLGRTYHETAQLFDRDRSTVSHACARIEDKREDRSAFEREVLRLEQQILDALDAEPGHALQ